MIFRFNLVPYSSLTLAGIIGDDPLSLPAIEEVGATLGTGGRTYFSVCMMVALNTGAALQAGDFYLYPLPQAQLGQDQRWALLQSVWAGP